MVVRVRGAVDFSHVPEQVTEGLVNLLVVVGRPVALAVIDVMSQLSNNTEDELDIILHVSRRATNSLALRLAAVLTQHQGLSRPHRDRSPVYCACLGYVHVVALSQGRACCTCLLV